MKKVLLVLTVLLAITLSGCGGEELEHNYLTLQGGEICEVIDTKTDCEKYYLAEEVDELLYVIEHWAEMNDVQLEDLWEEINLLEQRIEELEQFELLVEEWGLEIEAKLEPLECDNDCVIENIDNEILIATIGMIDILIYQYENTTEELTEEDEFIYNLLLMQRQELMGEIE